MIDIALIDGDAVDAGLVEQSLTGIIRRASGTAVFDDASNTWLLGDGHCASVVVDARVLHSPLTPNYLGRNDFAGPAFHSAEWRTTIDLEGMRVAVIGARAAHVVQELRAADVELFDCPPTWRTPKIRRRWMPAIRTLRQGPRLVTSPVERITHSGIRTKDGTDHEADAIVFATGSVVRPGLSEDALVGSRGLTIQQAWKGGAASYFGVAVHGFPNYFMLDGPDSPLGPQSVERRLDYIVECLARMRRKGQTRVEVRRSAQQQFVQRARVTRPSKAFDFSSGAAGQEIYDGPATLTIGGDEHPVRVRLTGHLDPIDGKYHWQGTVFATSSEFPSRPVELAISSLSAKARITEQTPWGSYSIAGVGAPPFDIGQPT